MQIAGSVASILLLINICKTLKIFNIILQIGSLGINVYGCIFSKYFFNYIPPHEKEATLLICGFVIIIECIIGFIANGFAFAILCLDSSLCGPNPQSKYFQLVPLNEVQTINYSNFPYQSIPMQFDCMNQYKGFEKFN